MTLYSNYFYQCWFIESGEVNHRLSLHCVLVCVFLCDVANGTAEQGEDSKVPEGETAEVISSPKEDTGKRLVPEVLYKVCMEFFFFFFALFVCFVVVVVVLPEEIVQWD